jgi:hypothetical protein
MDSEPRTPPLYALNTLFRSILLNVVDLIRQSLEPYLQLPV